MSNLYINSLPRCVDAAKSYLCIAQRPHQHHTINAHYVYHDTKRQRFTFFRKVKGCRAFDKMVGQVCANKYTVRVAA
jgi:hypothetical protein